MQIQSSFKQEMRTLLAYRSVIFKGCPTVHWIIRKVYEKNQGSNLKNLKVISLLSSIRDRQADIVANRINVFNQK